MNVIIQLQKIADGPALTSFAERNPEVSLIPLGAVVGASGARQSKRRPVIDVLRGALTGGITGAGGALGVTLGRRMSDDKLSGGLLGGGIGGLISFLAARRMLKGMRDDNEHEKRSVSPVLTQLLLAKEQSDKRDYKGKHYRLRTLIQKYPDDFYMDSVLGDIAGITHQPTGFRLHAPIRVLPVKLRGKPRESAIFA